MGSTRFPFIGRFGPSGETRISLATRTAGLLTLDLRFDLWQGTDSLTGAVSNARWFAELVANRSTFNSKTKPAPQAGRYTLVMPGSLEEPEQPGGDGYAIVTVASSGDVRVAGSLADGTKFSIAPVLVNHDWCPLYISLYGSQGFLRGWINFSNAPVQDPAGNFTWLKPPRITRGPYPNGFALQVNAIGAAYVPPGSHQPVISLQGGYLEFMGGSLPEAIDEELLVDPNNKLQLAPGSLDYIVFSLQTGVFRGTFKASPDSVKTSFSGVVLQRIGAGGGYFLQNGKSSLVKIGSKL